VQGDCVSYIEPVNQLLQRLSFPAISNNVQGEVGSLPHCTGKGLDNVFNSLFLDQPRDDNEANFAIAWRTLHHAAKSCYINAVSVHDHLRFVTSEGNQLLLKEVAHG